MNKTNTIARLMLILGSVCLLIHLGYVHGWRVGKSEERVRTEAARKAYRELNDQFMEHLEADRQYMDRFEVYRTNNGRLDKAVELLRGIGFSNVVLQIEKMGLVGQISLSDSNTASVKWVGRQTVFEGDKAAAILECIDK